MYINIFFHNRRYIINIITYYCVDANIQSFYVFIYLKFMLHFNPYKTRTQTSSDHTKAKVRGGICHHRFAPPTALVGTDLARGRLNCLILRQLH